METLQEQEEEKTRWNSGGTTESVSESGLFNNADPQPARRRTVFYPFCVQVLKRRSRHATLTTGGEVTWEGIAAHRASLVIQLRPSICAVARAMGPPGVGALVVVVVVPLPLPPLGSPWCRRMSLSLQDQDQNQD